MTRNRGLWRKLCGRCRCRKRSKKQKLYLLIWTASLPPGPNLKLSQRPSQSQRNRKKRKRQNQSRPVIPNAIGCRLRRAAIHPPCAMTIAGFRRSFLISFPENQAGRQNGAKPDDWLLDPLTASVLRNNLKRNFAKGEAMVSLGQVPLELRLLNSPRNKICDLDRAVL